MSTMLTLLSAESSSPSMELTTSTERGRDPEAELNLDVEAPSSRTSTLHWDWEGTSILSTSYSDPWALPPLLDEEQLASPTWILTLRAACSSFLQALSAACRVAVACKSRQFQLLDGFEISLALFSTPCEKGMFGKDYISKPPRTRPELGYWTTIWVAYKTNGQDWGWGLQLGSSSPSMQNSTSSTRWLWYMHNIRPPECYI